MRHVRIALALFIILPAYSAQGQDLSSADEYTQRAMARFEKNDLDGAIADFTKVIELKGQNLEFCYYFRGMAQYRKGNLDLAVADISKALAIKKHPRFYKDRGNLLAKQGHLDRALEDLNKAIELGPSDAKAYADRGLIRMMRGEESLAELDFKKSFELDRSLESQIRAAAAQIKLRNITRQQFETPSDIKIVKFNWSESPSTVLVATPSAAITTTTSNVSASGTRVMADPRAKSDPGPYDHITPTVQPARDRDTHTRTVLDYKFSIAIKNTGSKTIAGVQWGYFFYPKDPANDPLAYLFSSKTNIPPGKEKSLSDSIPAKDLSVSRAKLPNRYTRNRFDEKVVILRLDYADGSTWQSSPGPR
jgi:tetratricopeptide (TPR) repeat protein